MKTICIHQPAFCPWLGIVESMFACEVFVHLDNVQYEDGGVQNRNKIKTSKGAAWFTVPVVHNFGTLIKDVSVSRAFKPEKLIKMLEVNYRRAMYFEELEAFLMPILRERRQFLLEYSIPILENLAQVLNAPCRFVRASDLPGTTSRQIERVAEIYRCLDAKILYTGSGMKKYCSEEDFRKYAVKPLFHNYQDRHAVYAQRFPEAGFIPNLSFIDIVANIGFQQTADILRHSAAATKHRALLN